MAGSSCRTPPSVSPSVLPATTFLPGNRARKRLIRKDKIRAPAVSGSRLGTPGPKPRLRASGTPNPAPSNAATATTRPSGLGRTRSSVMAIVDITVPTATPTPIGRSTAPAPGHRFGTAIAQINATTMAKASLAKQVVYQRPFTGRRSGEWEPTTVLRSPASRDVELRLVDLDRFRMQWHIAEQGRYLARHIALHIRQCSVPRIFPPEGGQRSRTILVCQ